MFAAVERAGPEVVEAVRNQTTVSARMPAALRPADASPQPVMPACPPALASLADSRIARSTAVVIRRGRTKQAAAKSQRGQKRGKAVKSQLVGVSKQPTGRPSKGATDRSLAAAQKSAEWDFASGHKGSGRWTEDVTVRAPRSFADDRARQILRHIATAVFHYAKSMVDEEQEVQAMYVNERLFLSSNLPSSMAELRGLTGADLTELFLTSTYVPASDKRGIRSVEKLTAAVQGNRLADIPFDDDDEREEVAGIAGVISGLVRDPGLYLTHCTVDQAHQYVEGDNHQSKVIIVEGLRPVHAEQNLIVAYCRSGSSAPALVYGKKRPCTGCYLTFAYAYEVLGKTGLTYNHHPGGFWGPAVQGLWDVISQDQNIRLEDIDDFVDLTLPSMTFRSAATGSAKEDKRKHRSHMKSEETGYDTESDDEND